MSKMIRHVISTMTFRRKIFLIWVVAGVIPMVLVMAIFTARVMGLVEYQNRYALQKNFEQSCQTIEDKLGNIAEIARFLLADGEIQKAFRGQNAGTDDLEYMELYENIENTRRIFVDGNNLDEIVFYLDPALPMVGKSTGNKYRELTLLEQEDWCFSMLQDKESAKWGIITKDPVAFMENYFSYVHVIRDSENFNSITGMVCLGIRLDKLRELLVPILEGQYLYLISTDGVVISSDLEAVILEMPLQDGEVVQDGETYYCLSKEIDSTGVKLVSVIPKSVLNWRTWQSMTGVVAVLVLILGLISVAYGRMSGRLTVRINHLAEACRKAEDGVLVKIDVNGDEDEINTLCQAYNRMTDKINELLKEQYRIGEEVKDAQLKALQAQINPHFLYNTLEMVGWMAAKEDKRNVQRIIRNLSRYYKSVLNKGKDEINIWDEIHMSIAYMEIQSYRFKGKINFRSEIDEEIPDLMVPKLILQPLLENAIFHGVTKKPEGRGNIWLRAYRKEDKIVLEVSDDGVGFLYQEQDVQPAVPGEASVEKESGSRYGFMNIQRRIGLFWKSEAVMKVESTPGIGTSVYIMIPDCSRREDI